MARARAHRDAAIASAVERWFAAGARVLPWRPAPVGVAARDPYHALVSEAMLQQTQVSRVVERFGAFVAKFPTVAALAAAREDEVMALWSGLGYYRRARNLHAAARAIVDEHGGVVPRTAEELRGLPGVGRYTAGAIASIVHGERTPIVDGNVVRVLLRVENRRGKGADPAEPATQKWVWERAGELVGACGNPALFNEGLMELGATVCTPRAPRCGACPLARRCGARAAGRQELVPLAKTALRTRAVYCASVVVERGGRVLVEQRPVEAEGGGGDRGGGGRATGGMWAGLWQAPTLERADRPPTAAEVGAFIGAAEGRVSLADSFVHKTTHRTVHFDVWTAPPPAGGSGGRRRWMVREEVAGLGIASPQRRILLGARTGTPRLF